MKVDTKNVNSEIMDFLHSDSILEQIEEDISDLGLVGESRNKKLMYLIALSRRLNEPLSAVITGPPSSGKSRMLEIISSLQPPDEAKNLSRMTKNALQYLAIFDPYIIAHKFITMAEAHGSQEANYSLRTLLTEKVLRLQTVQGGNPITITLYGPISYCETTTKMTNFHEETVSRMLRLQNDFSPNQNRKVIQSLAAEAANSISTRSNLAIVNRHHEGQKMLNRNVVVNIPFASQIEFPYQHHLSRREFTKLLGVISASAYLHQFNRKMESQNGGWVIFAEKRDFEIAKDLTADLIKDSMDRTQNIPLQARSLLTAAREITYERDDDSVISRKDLVERTGLSLRQVRHWLEELVERDFLDVLVGSKGREYVYKLKKAAQNDFKIELKS